MRYTFFIILSSIIAFSCNKPKAVDSGTIPTSLFENKSIIVFEEQNWDFGKIREGEKVEHLFKFVNGGKNDLIISAAKGSCGCTVADYPDYPIKPGERGILMVKYDSKGKSGNQSNKVQIFANSEPAITELSIKANILK